MWCFLVEIHKFIVENVEMTQDLRWIFEVYVKGIEVFEKTNLSNYYKGVNKNRENDLVVLLEKSSSSQAQYCIPLAKH